MCRQGPDCLVRILATDQGRVFAQLHAGPVEAAFTAGAPQCLYSQGALQAVRMQVTADAQTRMSLVHAHYLLRYSFIPSAL